VADATAVPTLAESGYRGAVMESFNVILAPAGTPLPMRQKLNREFDAILKETSIRERLLVQGFEPLGGSVEDAPRFLQETSASAAN